MKRVIEKCLMLAWLALLGCDDQTSLQTAETTGVMFRGDPQHRGIYAAPAVHKFREIKWAHKTAGPVRSTPAVFDGTVYFGSGDSSLYAIDMRTGNEKWRFKTGGAVHSSPAIVGGAVYFTSRDGCLYAVGAQTGKQFLKFQTGETLPYQWGFDYYISSPLVADGMAYFGSGDGYLYACDIRGGKARWKFDTKSRVRSSPALADNMVYFGDTNGYFYALDSQTGAQAWRFETEGVKLNPAEFGFDRCAIISSPAISGDIVTFGGRDGFLYALDRRTGQQRWRFDHEISWVISSPAVSNGTLFTGTSDGRFVQAVDLNSGKEKWRFKGPETVWSSPAICDSLVYFGDGGGNFFAVDQRNGNEKWRFKTRDRIFSSPVVAGGVVYFGSDDGYLYALTGSTGNESNAKPTRRAVFWEASTGFNWFRFGADEQIRDYFVTEGYEKLDAKALAQFMRETVANETPSVVIFAAFRVPATVVNDSSEAALLRQYLNAGGKIVLLGAPPLAYKRDPKTDQVVALDFTIPERILGVRYPGNSAIGVGGWYQSSVTREGMKWGLLRDWWVGGFAVDVDQVTTVLARDEQGRASAWVKNYGGPDGTGLVQLWHKRDGLEDLVAIKAVAEYGLR
jgi:outer membrane protein assembly factor BamB